MKSHHIPLVIFLSFFFFKATVLQAMPPVIEKDSVQEHRNVPVKKTSTPTEAENNNGAVVASEEHEEYEEQQNTSSLPYFSDHLQGPQNQNSAHNPISNNYLAPNTPPPFAPAETPSSPGASHPSIVTTSDGRRIFQVPDQPHQERTNSGNFFSELYNQYRWKPVREATSSQEKFEEALSAIKTGKDLFSDQKKNEGDETEESQFIKRTFDGRTFDGRAMIRMIATGEVNLDDFQSLSLKDYSLVELSQALAVALSDNIIQDPDKKEPNEEVALRSANYRKNYNEAVEIGVRILGNLMEEKVLQVGKSASEKENGRLFKDYFFKTIQGLHESFTCLEEFREEGDSNSRDILLYKGMARIKGMEEELQPNPRPNIVQGWQEASALLERALRAHTEGRTTEAYYLTYPASALLEATREEARPEPRPNIVQGFKKALELFEKALRAHTEGQTREALYLTYQASALLGATREEAGPNPRPNIVQGFQEASALLERALRARTEGRTTEADDLYNQGVALYNSTRGAANAPLPSCVIS